MPFTRFALPVRFVLPHRIPALLLPGAKEAAPAMEAPAPTPRKKRWFKRLFADSLNAYGRSFFKMMALDYRSIVNPQPSAIREQLDALVDKPGAPTNWDDVYALERGLLVVMPEMPLRARVPMLRSEFENASTSEEYQDYLKTTPPDPQNAPVEKLRADALALIDQIQLRMITTPFFESLRRALLLQLVVCTALYFVLAFILLLVLGGHGDDTTSAAIAPQYSYHLLLAFFCGIFGGAVSTIQRIQAMPTNSSALTNVTALQGVHIALVSSPLIGGVSAGLLFFLCAGGELPSSIFPSIANWSTTPAYDLHVFSDFGAEKAIDAAKLVVWSFIAGFSERFIPDTVSRFTAKLSD
jgi:hypothetical protein